MTASPKATAESGVCTSKRRKPSSGQSPPQAPPRVGATKADRWAAAVALMLSSMSHLLRDCWGRSGLLVGDWHATPLLIRRANDLTTVSSKQRKVACKRQEPAGQQSAKRSVVSAA